MIRENKGNYEETVSCYGKGEKNTENRAFVKNLWGQKDDRRSYTAYRRLFPRRETKAGDHFGMLHQPKQILIDEPLWDLTTKHPICSKG